MDKEKNQNKQTTDEVSKITSEQTRSWKRFLNKKWVFPAVYLAAAALILAIIFWVQDPNRFAIDKDDLLPDLVINDESNFVIDDETAIPVTTNEVSFGWPVAEGLDVKIGMVFYDDSASDEVKATAMVQYSNGFWPHAGIDLTLDGKESFDVVAAADGKVIVAEHDPMVGYVVEIDHGDQRVTNYSSLQDLNVAVGDEVNKGDLIGKAGRNDFEKDMGVHLHFEIRENDVTVNPMDFLPTQG